MLDSRYIAQDGLVKLSPDDIYVNPYNNLTTPKNENGLTYMGIASLLGLYPLDPAATVRLCQHVQHPALLHRRAGLARRTQAQDDYIGAITALSAQSFPHPFALTVVDYGYRTGWCYNNVAPGQYSIRQTRQLGDVAWLKWMAGLRPHILEALWFILGTLINAFHSRPSETQLTWMRLSALMRYSDQRYSPSMRALTHLWVWIKSKRVKSMADNARRYYKDPDHPFHGAFRSLDSGFGL